MKRLVAIFIILVLTCFLFAGCDIVDSAIDGVNASKHDINNAISNLIHTHSYEKNIQCIMHLPFVLFGIASSPSGHPIGA